MDITMDVDSVKATQANIIKLKNQLNDQVTTLMQSVDGVIGSDWIAPGANQFQSEIQQWRSAMLVQIEQLEQLSTRLAAEVAEWEQTAQYFA